MNHFYLRVKHRAPSFRRVMHVFAVLFPIWGVVLPVTLALFVLLLLRLPANLHWFYALAIICGLALSSVFCALLSLVCDDDCLRLTHEGIQFPLRFALPLRGKLFRSWDELAVLKLRWSGESNFRPDDFIGFVFNDGSAMRIKSLHFENSELQQLLAAVKSCAKQCDLDPEFALLARSNSLASGIAPLPEQNIQGLVLGDFSLRFGVQSVVMRWFSEYWTPADRLLAPWGFVALLIAFLFWGPSLLLSLVSFLPMDELGNSGASLLAHNVLLVCAAAVSLCAALILLKPFFKPTELLITADGIQKIWNRAGNVCRSKLLCWNDVIAVYVLSRGRIQDNCRIVFATAKNARAFSILNQDIPDDCSRKLLADALQSLAGAANLAPDVFDVLKPCRTLSLIEIWDAAIFTGVETAADAKQDSGKTVCSSIDLKPSDDLTVSAPDAVDALSTDEDLAVSAAIPSAPPES